MTCGNQTLAAPLLLRSPDNPALPRIPAQEFLHFAANGFPDKTACWFYGSEISYYELRRQVLRLANALGGLGVQKGDRVGLHLPTSPQYVIAYPAVLSPGAAGVHLNPMYTSDESKGSRPIRA